MANGRRKFPPTGPEGCAEGRCQLWWGSGPVALGNV